MATGVTSFQDVSQIYSAVSVLNSALNVDAAMTWGQAAFFRAYNVTPSAYTYQSSTRVSIQYSNGDTATLYGSSLTSTTPYMTKLEYQFASGYSVVLDGTVTSNSSGALSGAITHFYLAKSNLGSIDVYGNTDVATDNLTLSKFVWNINGVHFEETGSMSGSIWTNGGYYQASHSGAITAGVLTANGMTLQASGFSIDPNTSASSGEGYFGLIFSGDDTISGEGTSVSLYGYGGSDILNGTSGSDKFAGGSGNDTLNGVAGVDTAIFSGNAADYSITKSSTGYTVTDNSGTDGLDTLIDIQRLQFANKKIALDVTPEGNTGKAMEFLGAVTPTLMNDSSIRGLIISLFDQGQTIESLSQLALNLNLLPSTTHAALANAVCLNVLGAEPNADLTNALVSFIEDHGQTSFIATVAGLHLNVDLVGLQQTGVEYLI